MKIFGSFSSLSKVGVNLRRKGDNGRANPRTISTNPNVLGAMWFKH